MADKKLLGLDGGVSGTIGASDAGVIDGELQANTMAITNDASIGGDLTVSGDIISRGTVDLVVQDNFIDLNAGNDSATALASGFTFSLNRNSGFTSSTVTTFVAGVASTSNPTFTATDAGSSSALAAGDVVFISGAAEASNDGLYVVNGVDQATFPQVVTIKGVGTVGTNANTPWAQTQFEADTGDSASAYKVDLKVLAIADGSNFPDSGGTATPKGTLIEVYADDAVESDFTGNGDYTVVGESAVTDLQEAYEAGNTISVDSTNGDLLIDSDTAATNNVRFGNTTNFAAFSADAAEVIIEATGSSGGDLVLTASNASGSVDIAVGGNTIIEAKGTVADLNTDVEFGKASGSAQVLKRTSTADGDDLTLQLTGANDASIILDNVAGTGVDAIKLDAQAGGVDISGNAASKFDVTSANLTLSTTTSGTLSVSSAGAFDIDGAAASAMTVTSGDLQVETVTSGAITIDSAENIDMNAVGGVTVDGTAISIDGTSASNLTATGANLTVSTVTSGNLVLTSAADVDLTAASELDIGAASSDIDITGALAINSGDTTNLTMDANADATKTLTIQANNTNAGGSAEAEVVVDADDRIKLQQGGADRLNISTNILAEVLIQASSTGGLRFGPSGQTVTEVDTDDTFASASNGALASQLAIKTYVDNQDLGKQDITLLTKDGGTTISTGDVVAVDASGEAIQADASAASTANVVGIAVNVDGNEVSVSQVGISTDVTASAGNTFYLSTTAGGITSTAPSGSGEIIYQIGYGNDTNDLVIVQQFIAELA